MVVSVAEEDKPAAAKTMTAAFLLTGVLICVSAWFSLAQSSVYAVLVFPVWPATGIAIAAVWLFGYRIWPAIAAGIAGALLLQGQAPGAALFVATVQVTEASLACYLLRHFIKQASPLEQIRDVWLLTAIIGLVTAPLSASLGTGGLVLSNTLAGSDVARAWLYWWVANVTGGILIAPLCIAWYLAVRNGVSRRRWLELALFAVGVAGIGWLAFDPRAWLGAGTLYGLGFLPAPLVLWATLRHQQLGATLSVFALSIVAFVLVSAHVNSTALSVAERGRLFIVTQLYFTVMSVFFLVVAALLFDRERVETQLRHQRRRLQTLLGNLPGMAYRCANDRCWTAQFVSAGSESLTGYGPQEFEARRVCWADIMHPEDREAVWRSVQQALARGEPFEVHYRILTRDGEEKWVWERGGAVLGERGEIEALEGFVTDVTQLEESKTALARSEAQAKAVLDTAVEAIVTIDNTGRIHSFNRAAETMFGYGADEVLGENVKLLMPESYRREHDDYIRHYLDTGEQKIIGVGREVTGRRKDGRTFPIELAVSEVLIHGERTFTGIIRDISERKEAEEALRQSHEQLQTTFQNAPIGIVTFRPGERFLSANRAFCDISGYSEAELRGLTLKALTHPDDWTVTERLAQQAQAGKIDHYSYEKRYIRKDGESVHVAVRNAVTHDRAGRPDLVIGQVEDLTQQRRAEQEASVHRERLAHVGRLSTLGEMAAGIAHEVNQPLTAISLYAQSCLRLLQADRPNLVKFGEALSKLNQQALRAGKILEQLQQLVRRRESQKELTDCNRLIRGIVNLADTEAHLHNIAVSLELAAELPDIYCDPVQIQQVTLNLLRNGMQAMQTANSSDSTIVVRTALNGSEEVLISVVDRGTGVPKAMQQTLFEPFSTDKESGMGVGLAICRSIIESHGGELGFYNNPDRGATFFFTLPRHTEELP